MRTLNINLISNSSGDFFNQCSGPKKMYTNTETCSSNKTPPRGGKTNVSQNVHTQNLKWPKLICKYCVE